MHIYIYNYTVKMCFGAKNKMRHVACPNFFNMFDLKHVPFETHNMFKTCLAATLLSKRLKHVVIPIELSNMF